MGPKRHQSKIVTLYGDVPPEQFKHFQEISGNYWNEENQDWCIVTELVHYWHLNNSDQRKYNEEKWYMKKGQLHIRDLNFEYAFYVCDEDVMRAMKYVKKMLIDLDGSPLYLPKEMAMKLHMPLDKKYPGYNKIIESAKRECRYRQDEKQKNKEHKQLLKK